MGVVEAVLEWVGTALLTVLFGVMVLHVLSVTSSFAYSEMKVVRSAAAGEGEEEEDDNGDAAAEDDTPMDGKFIGDPGAGEGKFPTDLLLSSHFKAETGSADVAAEVAAVQAKAPEEKLRLISGDKDEVTGAGSAKVHSSATVSDVTEKTLGPGELQGEAKGEKPDAADVIGGGKAGAADVADVINDGKASAGNEADVINDGKASSGEDADVMDDDDDEWEGLEEATEMEERFNAAAAAVVVMAGQSASGGGGGGGFQGLGEGMQLLLYALYKQATEGPCNIKQPGFFNLKARSKWDSWNKLGSMSSEEAMEKYVDLVEGIHPGAQEDPKNASKEGLDFRIDEGTKETSGGAAAGARSVSVFQHEEGHAEEEDTGLPQSDLIRFAADGDLAALESALAAKGPSEINATDDDGRTALHWAADRGQVEAVVLLLGKGASANVQDAEGQTALHYAAVCEHQGVAKALLSHGASPSIKDHEAKAAADLFPADWAL